MPEQASAKRFKKASIIEDDLEKFGERNITQIALEEWERHKDTHVFVAKEFKSYGDDKDVSIKYAPLVMPLSKFKILLEHKYSIRVYHEFVHPRLPCRLYVDIERKAPKFKFTKEDMENGLLPTVIGKIAKMYFELFQCALESPLILDACSYPDVFSVHLIYPNTWFSAPMQIKFFLMTCLGEDEIDWGCYWSNGHHPMRIAYNWKTKEPGRPLLPRINDKGETSKTFSWDVVMKSCVSASFARPSANCPIREIRPILEKAGYTRSSSSGVWSTTRILQRSQVGDMLSQMIVFVRALYGEDIQIHSACLKMPSGFEIEISPGIYCRHRAYLEGPENGYHHSHRTYICSDNWKDIYARCPSPKCVKRKMYICDVFSLSGTAFLLRS